MSRTARIIIGLIVLGLIIVVAVLAYIWISGGSNAPSAALVAPTLPVSTVEPTSADAAAATEPSSLAVFNIDPDQSEVRFILNEVLRGSPNKVTGRTNQVAGQIGIDFTNPQNSQVGEIRIDARSLSTDNELRNRAIRGQILQSAQDQFEFISFQPTAIDGLPVSAPLGQPFEFHITGDLTIRDITQSVSFDVTVTPVSQTEINGSANATVQRSDYNLEIPNVPGVADVDQAVRLEIDFVATTAAATQTP